MGDDDPAGPSADPARDLSRLWGEGRRPDVRTFLGRAGRLAPGQVAAVLRVDQAARWAAGDRVTARDYLRDFPALGDDPEAAFEVVYHERLLLEDRGESPDPEAFRRLYPEFADRLRVQEEVRAALARLAPENTAILSDEGPASPADRPRFAPIVAGYEILGELGRGGMGVVYKARHLRLNRVVAVKMLRAGDAAPDVVARLLAEAEAVARLRHPHIIQLHGVGDAEGRPFLEMEYVAGGSLADRLDGTPRPPRAMAELVEALARALHEAHRLGVVHRDVKPANVLIAEDGTPKLTDFGLAKLLGASANPVAMTRSGALLGTPSYMAPEQADGRTREVGPAADVHALGVLLYELLTGRRPFPGPSVVETLEQIRSVAPTPPRSLVPTLPRDLETACLKCLEKDPARRYADARTLADDLRNYLSGAPIVARPSGVLDRLARAIGQGRHDRDFAAAGSVRLWTFIPFLARVPRDGLPARADRVALPPGRHVRPGDRDPGEPGGRGVPLPDPPARGPHPGGAARGRAVRGPIRRGLDDARDQSAARRPRAALSGTRGLPVLVGGRRDDVHGDGGPLLGRAVRRRCRVLPRGPRPGAAPALGAVDLRPPDGARLRLGRAAAPPARSRVQHGRLRRDHLRAALSP